MGIAAERAIDKRIQWVQKIEQKIAEYANGKFTGKLIIALNMSQGGITDGSIQTDSKLN